MKHTEHIRHIGHVPLVERLVEGVCIKKHTFHIRHTGHVPIIERMVEGGCAMFSGWLKDRRSVLPQITCGQSRGARVRSADRSA